MAEVVDRVFSGQQIDRIADFVRYLDARLSVAEQQTLRGQLTDENATDLMGEAIRQAVRAVSSERRAYIANLIANGVASANISHIESKHLLRILGDLNDVEIIRLGRFRLDASHQDYFQKHQAVLAEPFVPDAAPREEHDKQILRESYDDHLVQLGLLVPRYSVDFESGLPRFDRLTGRPESHGYLLTRLGGLLLRHIAAPAPRTD